MDKYCICWRRKNSSKDASPLIFNHPNSRQEAMIRGDYGEISNRDKDSKSKREFVVALESIQNYIDDKISYFDFFFAVEGLELEDLDKISCNKVEIFAFNQELCEQMITAYFGEIDSQKPVERSLGWFNWCRRLSKDYEILPQTHETFVQVAMIRLMLRRLA